jgi:hypothetical protein
MEGMYVFVDAPAYRVAELQSLSLPSSSFHLPTRNPYQMDCSRHRTCSHGVIEGPHFIVGGLIWAHGQTLCNW